MAYCPISTCNNENIFKVDEEMIPILRVLYKAGYKTQNCCAGHFGTTCNPYITFYGYHDSKDILPITSELEVTHTYYDSENDILYLIKEEDGDLLFLDPQDDNKMVRRSLKDYILRELLEEKINFRTMIRSERDLLGELNELDGFIEILRQRANLATWVKILVSEKGDSDDCPVQVSNV
jgi:hypothetical protein